MSGTKGKAGTRRMAIFRYILRDTWRLLARNLGLSVLTFVTAVAVFYLVGASVLLVMNTRAMIAGVESNLFVQAYVKDGEDSMRTVAAKMQAMECVASVETITPQQALENLKARLGSQADAVTLLGDNPLPASVQVQVKKAEFATVVARELIAMPEVDDVVYSGELADRLGKISSFVSRLSMVILAICIAAASLVLFNTIRISVYARKDEIETMLLVGATPAFVAFPFVLQGVTLGVLGALFASGILYFSYGYAINALIHSLPFLTLIKDRELVLRLGIVLVGGGVTIGWICSWLAVSKFIRAATRPQ
ncbi:MAG: cell division transport system permease protein [Synergistales bacterium]|nr:cell division transport system permease protein [Synergistales bacterium]